MQVKDERKDVKDFFQGYARKFHDIYSGEGKSSFERFLDRRLRSSMFSRFETVFSAIQQCGAKTVLDVGCGPGTHDAILARELGVHITGVDVAPNMIELAKANVAKAGVAPLCDFQVGDFEAFAKQRKFDAIFSVGVVEYIKEPGPFVKKMYDLADKAVIFSVPVKWHVLTPQRSVRYWLRNCPLWFYSRTEIAAILKKHGMHDFKIHEMGRDYVVVISKAAGNK